MSLFIILIILLIIITISNSNTRENFASKKVIEITESNIDKYITRYFANNGITGPLTIDGSSTINGDISGLTIDKLVEKINMLYKKSNDSNAAGNISNIVGNATGNISNAVGNAINSAAFAVKNNVTRI